MTPIKTVVITPPQMNREHEQSGERLLNALAAHNYYPIHVTPLPNGSVFVVCMFGANDPEPADAKKGKEGTTRKRPKSSTTQSA